MKTLFDDCDDLQPLAEAIRKNAAVAKQAGKIPDLLCPFGVGDAQQRACEEIIYPALHDTLEAAKRKKNITEELLHYSLQLVGWIATTFVNDLWIQAHGASLSDYSSPSSISIKLKEGQLIELIVARAHIRCAGVKKSGIAKFESSSGLVFQVPDAASCTLLFVFQQLMQRFMPDEDCNEMTDKHWEDLDTKIRIKRRIENIFVAFDLPEQWRNVRAELARKLQCLPQFWLEGSDKSGSLLLLSESKVCGLIAETVKLIEDYRPYAK